MKIEHAEYAEGYPIEILKNYRTSLGCWTGDAPAADDVQTPCPHAFKFEDEEEEAQGGAIKLRTRYATIPIAVRAWNEGHCNCTIVCLDCVMDALRENGDIP